MTRTGAFFVRQETRRHDGTLTLSQLLGVLSIVFLQFFGKEEKINFVTPLYYTRQESERR